MGFQTHKARERDEAERQRQRIARLTKALSKADCPKRAELTAELERIRVLRLSPTI